MRYMPGLQAYLHHHAPVCGLQPAIHSCDKHIQLTVCAPVLNNLDYAALVYYTSETQFSLMGGRRQSVHKCCELCVLLTSIQQTLRHAHIAAMVQHRWNCGWAILRQCCVLGSSFWKCQTCSNLLPDPVLIQPCMGTGSAGTHHCKLYVVCLHTVAVPVTTHMTVSALQVPAMQQLMAWHIA